MCHKKTNMSKTENNVGGEGGFGGRMTADGGK